MNALVNQIPTALAGRCRVVFRMSRLALHLIKGLVYARVLLGGVEQGRASTRQQKIIQRWLTQLAEIIGIQSKLYKCCNKGVNVVNQPVLIVANHKAWTDILLIATYFPASFLSHAGVRTWPVAGFLARRSGTLFIERGAQGAVAQARATVCRSLRQGRTVAVFPEGRTHQSATGKFYPHLFSAAIDSGVAVQPIAIRYLDKNGSLNRHAAFVRGEGMVAHTFRQMRAAGNIAEVIVCPVIQTHGCRRASVAQAAHQSITRQLASSAGDSISSGPVALPDSKVARETA